MNTQSNKSCESQPIIGISDPTPDALKIPISTDDHQNLFMSTKRKYSETKSPSKKRKRHTSDGQTSISKSSLFQSGRLKIHVAVPPACTSLDTFLTTHLTSTILLTHTKHGTIVAFSNFKGTDSGRIIDECPFAWSWFEGDIVLFNPQVGDRIRGTVTLSSPDHIALITHSLFNASIPRTNMPEDWVFEEDTWYRDGTAIEGEIEFEVTQYPQITWNLLIQTCYKQYTVNAGIIEVVVVNVDH